MGENTLSQFYDKGMQTLDSMGITDGDLRVMVAAMIQNTDSKGKMNIPPSLVNTKERVKLASILDPHVLWTIAGGKHKINQEVALEMVKIFSGISEYGPCSGFSYTDTNRSAMFIPSILARFKGESAKKLIQVLSEVKLGSVQEEAIARHPDCPPDLLEKWVKNTDGKIRRMVAEHPNCTPKILLSLSKDTSATVRESVASNPKTPKQVLLSYLDDKSASVRESVASHVTTKEVLDEIVAREDINLLKHAVMYTHVNQFTPDLLSRINKVIMSRIDQIKSPDMLNVVKEMATRGFLDPELLPQVIGLWRQKVALKISKIYPKEQLGRDFYVSMAEAFADSKIVLRALQADTNCPRDITTLMFITS